QAIRCATPYSQGPSEPGARTRSDPARRTSTRKVAWKASSAAWASPSTCRQTVRTIAPWPASVVATAASAGRSRRRAHGAGGAADPAPGDVQPLKAGQSLETDQPSLANPGLVEVQPCRPDVLAFKRSLGPHARAAVHPFPLAFDPLAVLVLGRNLARHAANVP